MNHPSFLQHPIHLHGVRIFINFGIITTDVIVEFSMFSLLFGVQGIQPITS